MIPDGTLHLQDSRLRIPSDVSSWYFMATATNRTNCLASSSKAFLAGSDSLKYFIWLTDGMGISSNVLNRAASVVFLDLMSV